MTKVAELKGDKELKDKLEKLGTSARSSLLTAAEAGAEIVRVAANENAPAPHVEISSKVEESRAEVSIGPDKEHWYYQFLETGAGPHEIKGNPYLAFEGRNGAVITKLVHHPGMAAKPFLRSAMDGNKDTASSAVGEVFRKEINKLVE